VTQSAESAPSAAELEAEIAQARDNLASTIQQLKAETTPKAMARRAVGKAKGFFVDEYGGVRPERVAMVAGAVVTLVVLKRWRRSRRRCHCH
jgi:ubiquitin